MSWPTNLRGLYLDKCSDASDNTEAAWQARHLLQHIIYTVCDRNTLAADTWEVRGEIRIQIENRSDHKSP